MDKDRVAGSAKKIKGSIKEVVGKAAGDAKLEAEGKADKIEGKVQNAVGGLKDTLKSIASTRLRATSQRKTLLASAAMIGVDVFCGPAGAQGVSQSASPTSQTRLAKPSRSRRRSDGSYVSETALIPDVVPPAAPERLPRQRYEDWGDHVPMFLFHSVNSSHPKQGQRRFDRHSPVAYVLTFTLREEYRKWHSHRSIRRASITTTPPLTTMPPRIITTRRPIITSLASTKRGRSTQLRLSTIASLPTNIPRLPTVILTNDDGMRGFIAVAPRVRRVTS